MTNMENKEFILNVCTRTWTRDSHGLFDYESVQVKPHEGNILDMALVVRKKMDIKLVKSVNEIKDEELLFEIKNPYSKKILTKIKNTIKLYKIKKISMKKILI
jgi:hypothetical protein